MTPIYVLTLRQLAGKARLLILLGLSVIPVILGAVAGNGSGDHSPSHLDDALVDGLVASAILPIVALAVATAAFGNEMEDRTLSILALTPLPRWKIVVAKYAATLTVATPLLVAGSAGGMLVAFEGASLDGGGRAALAVGVAVAAGVAMYSALFLWAGLVASHPLAYGLLYAFVWEGLVGTFVNGIKYVSVRQYTLGLVQAVDASRFTGPDQSVIGTVGAIVGAAVVCVGFVALAVRRLRQMDVP